MRLLFASAAIAVTLFSHTAYAAEACKLTTQTYETIQTGMTRDQVEEKLGCTPYQVMNSESWAGKTEMLTFMGPDAFNMQAISVTLHDGHVRSKLSMGLDAK